MDLPFTLHLKDASPVVLDIMQPEQVETVRELLNHIISEGVSYPQDQPLSPQDFQAYWMKGEAFVVRRTLGADREATMGTTAARDIVGAFYIKPNFPGRCGHICNAGFIVPPEVRGQGVGRLMGEAMLTLARDRGYRAVMYNLIFETNIPSLKLWESLGFQEIGRIPGAAHLPDGRYVDAIMLYCPLT
ncbi:MAG: GNAT family N-acetyltransferase [Cyanobacteria bacterium]|nr:GNAT family N-acetyltransferase [Cyanobacteriota bacterium]MDA0867453.1 GNAT family N-acetyltransferase [Cyanobacteriota bacterium]